ncbi:MAG: hypothetical protein JWO83_4865 [Caulobacteraceae bacterium]|jgi:hypothetical protein|nr:hypothetical protein [Caulobacteraceae bacterium]
MDMGDATHPLMVLPFARNDGNVITLWSAGLENGHALADAAIAFMYKGAAPPVLGQIAKAQIAAGVYGRTEIEFWQRIAEYALR